MGCFSKVVKLHSLLLHTALCLNGDVAKLAWAPRNLLTHANMLTLKQIRLTVFTIGELETDGQRQHAFIYISTYVGLSAAGRVLFAIQWNEGFIMSHMVFCMFHWFL